MFIIIPLGRHTESGIAIFIVPERRVGMQFDDSQLDAENAALIALVETCEKPDTWSSLTNDCIMEGSAIRVLKHKIDPENNPLRESEYVPFTEQGELFRSDDVASPSEYNSKVKLAWERAVRQVSEWRARGLDLITVFDERFPVRLRAIVDVPPFLNGMLQSLIGCRVAPVNTCSDESDSTPPIV